MVLWLHFSGWRNAFNAYTISGSDTDCNSGGNVWQEECKDFYDKDETLARYFASASDVTESTIQGCGLISVLCGFSLIIWGVSNLQAKFTRKIAPEINHTVSVVLLKVCYIFSITNFIQSCSILDWERKYFDNSAIAASLAAADITSTGSFANCLMAWNILVFILILVLDFLAYSGKAKIAGGTSVVGPLKSAGPN